MNERPVLKLRKNREWTSADDDRLRMMLFAGDAVADIARQLNRSGEAIRSRANFLEVSSADNLKYRERRNDFILRRMDKNA